jgi:Tat protein secretion system quality control protein TatD with DNase activity/DNA-directed RNA polymerase subunit RPC12/RpoP
MGTHFSQETLLKQSIQLAEKLQLPTILHLTDLKSVERAVEVALNDSANDFDEENEEEGGGGGSQVFIIHDVVTCTGADLEMRDTLVKLPNVYFIVSGAGLAESDEAVKEKAREFVKGLPVDRILIATDSPWRTPQNLADAYLRTTRNEPANVPAVIEAISETLGMDKGEVMNVVKDTSLRLFNLEFLSPEHAAAAKLHAQENHAEEIAKSVQNLTIKSESVPEERLPSVETAKQSNATSENAEYKCTKCRSLLFKPKDVTTHQFGASKTVFKVGEEGLCTSFIFVGAQDGREIHKRLGVSIRGGNVECTHCGTKLGKFSPGEAVCPCGALVTGPVAKINATKTDFSDGTTDAKELAERAKIEIEDAQRQAEMEDQEMEEKWQNQQGRVKKVKKHKSENKGNFSNFRNKSFIPNASKTAKDTKEAGKDQTQNKKVNNNKGQNSDDDQEDEYDSQDEDGEV